jgi:hypothetical protein
MALLGRGPREARRASRLVRHLQNADFPIRLSPSVWEIYFRIVYIIIITIILIYYYYYLLLLLLFIIIVIYYYYIILLLYYIFVIYRFLGFIFGTTYSEILGNACLFRGNDDTDNPLG